MADRRLSELRQEARLEAAQANATIERTYFAHLGRYARLTRGVSRFFGAVALGILSAGFAVFAVMIVLNAIFQYAPSP